MKDVVLGLPGPWADDNREVSDHYTSKVGGLPDWPFPESALGSELLQCNSCASAMCLIAQVYAPITTAAVKIEERIIYIFGCTSVPCGSWRAIRVQKPIKSEELNSGETKASHSTVSVTSTSDSKWWDDLYSFETGSEDIEEKEDIDILDLARAFSEAANIASGSKKNGTKRHTKGHKQPHLSPPSLPKSRELNGCTLVLPCFYICYQEDKSGHNRARDEPPVIENGHDPIQGESWEEESYEYDKALNADRSYLKFKKRIDGCPEQCLRYSLGGKPLLVTGVAGDSGLCGVCGEPKHYEMQLTPPLVYFLQERAIGVQRKYLDNWSWMTLVVFTCSKSCFQKLDQGISNRNGWTVVEETVIAQFE